MTSALMEAVVLGGEMMIEITVNRYHDRGRRPRSRSPGYRGGRGKGRGRRSRSPVREGSAERRAKIEQWNREREQMPFGDKNNNKDRNSDGGGQNGAQYHDLQQQHDEYNYSSN